MSEINWGMTSDIGNNLGTLFRAVPEYWADQRNAQLLGLNGGPQSNLDAAAQTGVASLPIIGPIASSLGGLARSASNAAFPSQPNVPTNPAAAVQGGPPAGGAPAMAPPQPANSAPPGAPAPAMSTGGQFPNVSMTDLLSVMHDKYSSAQDRQVASLIYKQKIDESTAPDDIKGFIYAKKNGLFTGSLQDWQQMYGHGTQYFAPQMVYDEKSGKWTWQQFNNRGGQPSVYGGGLQPAMPTRSVETVGPDGTPGTVQVPTKGPANGVGGAPSAPAMPGAPGGFVPGGAQQKAEATARGTAQGGMQAGFPEAQRKLDQVDAAIKDIETDPNLSTSLGVGGLARSVLPSSYAAGVRRRIDTLRSQEFGLAIQGMRGLGSLSNAEGSKVQAAIANLDPNANPEDFAKALKQVKDAMAGFRKAVMLEANGQGKGMAEQQQQLQPPTGGPGTSDPYGLR
jgi:hypothetical protein